MYCFNKNIIVISAIVAAAFLISFNASSKPADIKNVPNGKKFSCTLCHADGKKSQDNLTQFGKDYDANKKIWDANLAKKSSDGSGKTNGQKLGDPDGKWKKGDADPVLK